MDIRSNIFFRASIQFRRHGMAKLTSQTNSDLHLRKNENDVPTNDGLRYSAAKLFEKNRRERRHGRSKGSIFMLYYWYNLDLRIWNRVKFIGKSKQWISKIRQKSFWRNYLSSHCKYNTFYIPHNIQVFAGEYFEKVISVTVLLSYFVFFCRFGKSQKTSTIFLWT